MSYKLSDRDIKLIIGTLERGDRVELIPTKDGIKLLRVKRELLTKENK